MHLAPLQNIQDALWFIRRSEPSEDTDTGINTFEFIGLVITKAVFIGLLGTIYYQLVHIMAHRGRRYDLSLFVGIVGAWFIWGFMTGEQMGVYATATVLATWVGGRIGLD